MKAKILTLAYPSNDNYGAALQAWALKSFLEQNGVDAAVIWLCRGFASDFQIKRLSASRKYPHGQSLSSDLRRTFRLIRAPVEIVKTRIKDDKKNKKSERIRAFESFLRRYCYAGGRPLADTTILKRGINADAVFVGSDWVWRWWPLSGQIKDFENFWKVFFGFFPKREKQKLYAYAASTGIVPSKALPEFWSAVYGNFNKVSLREQESIDYIRDVCGVKRPAFHAVDPTLLLPPQFYRDFLANLKEKPKLCSQSYLLAYVLSSEYEEPIKRCIKQAQQHFHLPLICLNQKGEFSCDDALIIGEHCGPLEFLAYIQNAGYVITNSFHGMVFCTMFQKRFTAFARSENDVRQLNLARGLGLEERLLPYDAPTAAEELFDKPIDFAQVEERRRRWTAASNAFLQQCLSEERLTTIEKVHNCTGCLGCQGVCRSGAIKAVPDKFGFIKALVDEPLCNYCGRCGKSCPQLNRSAGYNALETQRYFAVLLNSETTPPPTSMVIGIQLRV